VHHHIGELLDAWPEDKEIPPGFVLVNNPATVGIKPPPGLKFLHQLMYVGDAAQAVAVALQWERDGEREACARVAEAEARPDIAEKIRARGDGSHKPDERPDDDS
jgi:hypothetical protein